MKNTTDENKKIIELCDRFLAHALELKKAGVDLSDLQFSIAGQSVEVNQMFDELENNASAPTPSVPALESGRSDFQNADNAVYRHQSIFEKDQVTTNLHCRWCDVPDWHYPLNEVGLCSECAVLSDLGLTPVYFAGLNKIDCEGNVVPFFPALDLKVN